MSEAIQPISKYSKEIHRPKGDTDDRSIAERFNLRPSAMREAPEAREELAIQQRIKDPKAIKRCTAWGKCQWCGCKGTTKATRLEAAHIIPKTSPQGHDIDENLVCLCRDHHQKAHTGKLPRKILALIAAERNAK